MGFKKTVEDFTCEHCGRGVQGTGYTNHCPYCLWSKHVDREPGDRAATCGGMMEPIELEGSSPDYFIVHRCVTCGYQKRNGVDVRDNLEAVLAIAKKREKRNT